MKTHKIADLKFVRAGTDFLGTGWSAHIDAPADFFEYNECYLFEREDGSTYQVTVIHRRDVLDGKRTWMVVDDQTAMMMDF